MSDDPQSFDIVVVGAGPAGLAAMRAAVRGGCSVALIDDNPRPGGQIWRNSPGFAAPRKASPWLDEVRSSQVRYLPGTRIVASLGPKTLLVEDTERAACIRYGVLILCCGARELLLPFPGWTLPGVTGAGALQALVKNGTPVEGSRVVVSGSGPLLLAIAKTARAAGARIAGVFEQASAASLLRFTAGLVRWPGKLAQAVSLARADYRPASYVVEASGDTRLRAVKISIAGRVREIDCDRLACGFGLVPNTGLAQHLGCRLEGNRIAIDELQRTSVDGVLGAGECTGIGGSELSLVEGELAGRVASHQTGGLDRLLELRDHWRAFAIQVARCFELTPAIRQLATADTLVCRCEDVPLKAIAGEPDWTTAKLHSRCGMGACQGRVCGAAASVLFGWEPPAPRIPLVPARIETLLLRDSAKR